MEEGFSTVGLISLGLNPWRQVGRLVYSVSVGSPYWRSKHELGQIMVTGLVTVAYRQFNQLGCVELSFGDS